MTGYYKVADFCFAVTLLADRDLGVLLPSFCPFVWESGEEKLFELNETASLPERPEAVLIDEDRNDMGHTRVFRIEDGYRIELRYVREDLVHVFETNADFTKVSAVICWEDRYAPVALSSMLRIVFSQAIIPHAAVSMHASVVVNEGKAVLFMGKSGTGKSTHSGLWLRHIPNTELLNDDNPAVRIDDEGRAMVYGTPWSGKTPCYKNKSLPIGAIVRLEQAPRNEINRLSPLHAFSSVLSSCSSMIWDKPSFDAITRTSEAVVKRVSVFFLRCLPDEAAARLCHETVANHTSEKTDAQ